MYEDRKEKFSIRDLVLQILFILLFIFLLMWLFPTRSDVKTIAGKCDSNSTSAECKNTNSNDNSILYDRIFNENVLNMKDAAKSYFTTERLPQTVGSKTTMTLSDMLSKKIILPFKDKNGKTCSEKDSYVEVTKTKANEYVLKVNLKCGSEENYILVYMGCYDYCTTSMCEKNKADVKTPVLKKVTTPSKTTNVTVHKTTSTPSPKTYTCKIADGKYWGIDGKSVSKETYDKECTTPSKGNTITNIINNVTNVIIIKGCNECKPVTYTCKIVDGKYWGKDGKIVDKDTYIKECTTPTPTPTPTSKPTPTPTPQEKVCEYIKVENGSFSNWSNWSEWGTTAKNANVLTQVKTRKQTTTTTKKVLVGYNVTTYDDTSKPIYKTVQVQTGTSNKQVCSEYKNVTSTSAGSYSNWSDAGLVKYYSVPSNTNTTKYVFVSRGVDSCENCSYREYRVYRKYTRTYTQGKTTTTKECAKYTTVSTPIYTTKKVIASYEKAQKKEPVYKEVKQTSEVTQYSYRTRSVIKGKTLTKWDTCNNSSLEKEGYKKTGNQKNK